MVMMSIHRHRLRVPVILNEQSMFSVNVPVKRIPSVGIQVACPTLFPMACCSLRQCPALPLLTSQDVSENEWKSRCHLQSGYHRNKTVLQEEPAPDHPFSEIKYSCCHFSRTIDWEQRFSNVVESDRNCQRKKLNLIILGEGEMRVIASVAMIYIFRMLWVCRVSSQIQCCGWTMPTCLCWVRNTKAFRLSW